jgi:hypothetical protein
MGYEYQEIKEGNPLAEIYIFRDLYITPIRYNKLFFVCEYQLRRKNLKLSASAACSSTALCKTVCKEYYQRNLMCLKLEGI